MSVDQYLERYAEPEAALVARVDRHYEVAIVLPVLGETDVALDGPRSAVRELAGRALLILVVNANPRTPPELAQQNRELLAALGGRPARELAPGAALLDDPDFDVLVLDRSSAGRELPLRQGVGLARKVGCDLALALHRAGRLASPWIHWTDADATLPRDHFAGTRRALARPESAGVVALCFPFLHVPGADSALARATLVHEICLRYHVLGLGLAGSPYAHHSLGSALAVHALAYAAVRGVPKRQAGEDFYLLDKLAKLGKLARVDGEAIAIRSRRSSRVPFGTGPRVERILEEGEARVASPAAFRTLGALLGALDAVALERRLEPFDETLAGLPSRERSAAAHALDVLGARDAARVACRTSGSDLRRRLHTWFDALRTLQTLHRLRDAGLEDVPFRRALAQAGLLPEPRAGNELEQILIALRARENQLPRLLGPAALA